MKRGPWALMILFAVCLLLWAVLATLPRLGRYGETARAFQAITDCYMFVFRAAMDDAGPDKPFRLPRKLEDVPGWTEHVAGVADPKIRKFYSLIDWHPPENPAAGQEIASIELSRCRVVLLSGGSVFAVNKQPGGRRP